MTTGDWRPAFEAWTRHVHACSQCYPRAERYCDTGRDLYDDYTARYLLAENTKREIRTWLDLQPNRNGLRARLNLLLEQRAESVQRETQPTWSAQNP